MRFLRWKTESLKRRLLSLMKRKPRAGLDVNNLVDLSVVADNDRRLWEAHVRAITTHRTTPYDGHVILLRTHGHPFDCSYDPRCGWMEFATKGILVRTLPGLHEGLLEEPYVAECARELKFYLAAAQAQNPAACIRNLTPSDLPAVAAIHKAAFPRMAVSRLGRNAAQRYYESVLTGPYTVAGFGAFEGEKLQGYVFVGTRHTAARIFVRRNLLYLARCLAVRPWMLKDPFILGRISAAAQMVLGVFRTKTGDVQTDPRSPGSSHVYCLQYIALDQACRGRGLGATLLESCVTLSCLEASEGIFLSVYLDNARAIRLYERMGWLKHPSVEEWQGFMFKPTSKKMQATG